MFSTQTMVVGNVLTDSLTQGPFASCLKIVHDFFDATLKLVKAASDVYAGWNAIEMYDALYKDPVNDRNIFSLVDSMKVDIQAIAAESEAIPLSVQTSTDILSMIATFKADLQGHEINIILGGFLMDGLTIFDFSYMPGGETLQTRTPRPPKNFVSNFPYDYLACLYKISVDCYLRHLDKIDFKKESNRSLYMDRARRDVNNVSSTLPLIFTHAHAIIIIFCRSYSCSK